MTLDLARETAALDRLSIGDLRQRFADLFGEPTRTGNRIWLIKRLAWRLQALHEGDLSDRARQRIVELANDGRPALDPAAIDPAGTNKNRAPLRRRYTPARPTLAAARDYPHPPLQGDDPAGPSACPRI
jgi:hypothetical protein